MQILSTAGHSVTGTAEVLRPISDSDSEKVISYVRSMQGPEVAAEHGVLLPGWGARGGRRVACVQCVQVLGCRRDQIGATCRRVAFVCC